MMEEEDAARHQEINIRQVACADNLTMFTTGQLTDNKAFRSYLVSPSVLLGVDNAPWSQNPPPFHAKRTVTLF